MLGEGVRDDPTYLNGLYFSFEVHSLHGNEGLSYGRRRGAVRAPRGDNCLRFVCDGWLDVALAGQCSEQVRQRQGVVDV